MDKSSSYSVFLVEGDGPTRARLANIIMAHDQLSLLEACEDLTYTEIAELLSMSPNTITSHIKHIYRKLELRSRSEAVFGAVQLGLIDLH